MGRCASVCVSVCLSITRRYCIETAAQIELVFGIQSTYLTLHFRKLRHLQSISIWNCCPTLWTRTFGGHGTSAVAECDQQATVVILPLTTLGDGGRGHLLIAFIVQLGVQPMVDWE